MRPRLDYQLATFTPKEVERITGLSSAMQRDWRHRGLLPSYDRHARFTPFELATMWAMKLLADAGRGPKITTEIAPAIGAAVLFNALLDEGSERSIGGESIRTTFQRWSEQGLIPPQAMPGEDRPRSLAEMDQAAAVIKTIFLANAQPVIERRDEVTWWPTGEIEFGGFSKYREGKLRDDDQVVGPVTVMDLDTLGYALARRVNKPMLLLGAAQ